MNSYIAQVRIPSFSLPAKENEAKERPPATLVPMRSGLPSLVYLPAAGPDASFAEGDPDSLPPSTPVTEDRQTV
jgi:hypothetical protein